MAAVSKSKTGLKRIRDPKIECMSRDEMAALQSRRLVRGSKQKYIIIVEFYRKKK